MYYRAGGNDPAALVLAGPVFLKIKMNFHFLQKASNNKSASLIFGLVRLSYNRKRISAVVKLSAVHAFN